MISFPRAPIRFLVRLGGESKMKIYPPLNVVRAVYVTQNGPTAKAIAPSVCARPEMMSDRV
jgi:hypothetical protein